MAVPVRKEGCTNGGRCDECEIDLARRGLDPKNPLVSVLNGLCNLRTHGRENFYSQKGNTAGTEISRAHQSS